MTERETRGELVIAWKTVACVRCAVCGTIRYKTEPVCPKCGEEAILG